MTATFTPANFPDADGAVTTPFPPVSRATAIADAAAEHLMMARNATADMVQLNQAPGPSAADDDG
jgi:hypothetical protein